MCSHGVCTRGVRRVCRVCRVRTNMDMSTLSHDNMHMHMHMHMHMSTSASMSMSMSMSMHLHIAHAHPQEHPCTCMCMLMFMCTPSVPHVSPFSGIMSLLRRSASCSCPYNGTRIPAAARKLPV